MDKNNSQSNEIIVIEKCVVCGNNIYKVKEHMYLQYIDWLHSFDNTFQRCFKRHFGYDIDNEQLEVSIKIFYLKEKNEHDNSKNRII